VRLHHEHATHAAARRLAKGKGAWARVTEVCGGHAGSAEGGQGVRAAGRADGAIAWVAHEGRVPRESLSSSAGSYCMGMSTHGAQWKSVRSVRI
jgi:hypothetical protein